MSVDPRPDQAVLENWHGELDRVCATGSGVRLAFQPIVDLERGAVAGYEALARFDRPGLPASPLPWLEAAAEAGRLVQLEAAILDRALRQRSRLPPNAFLSINVGPHAALDARIGRRLAEAGDLRGVVLEITEHDRVFDYDALHAALRPALQAGALLAVDDAGAGYASLGHVLAMRPSFVKLDRGIVRDCDRDASRAATVAAIGALAGELDAWIIAEGVERPEELRTLAGLRVPLAQGYLLGRPADGEMGEVSEEGRSAIGGSAGPAGVRRTVGQLAMPVATKPATGEAARELDELDELDELVEDGRAAAPPTVLVDEHGRPVGLEDRHGHACFRPPTCVIADDDLAHVALRAAGRDPTDRLRPIVCCDELGRAAGILTVDRVLGALAREALSGQAALPPDG